MGAEARPGGLTKSSASKIRPRPVKASTVPSSMMNSPSSLRSRSGRAERNQAELDAARRNLKSAPSSSLLSQSTLKKSPSSKRRSGLKKGDDADKGTEITGNQARAQTKIGSSPVSMRSSDAVTPRRERPGLKRFQDLQGQDCFGRDEVQRAYENISPMSPKTVFGQAGRDDVLKMYMGKPAPDSLPLDTPGPARYTPQSIPSKIDFSQENRSSAFSGHRSDIRAGYAGSTGSLGPGEYEGALRGEAVIAPSSTTFSISTTTADDYDKLYTGNWSAKNGYRQSPEPGFKYSPSGSTMLDSFTQGPSFSIGKGPDRGLVDTSTRDRPKTAPHKLREPVPKLDPYAWLDPERAVKARKERKEYLYMQLPHNLGKNVGPSPKLCTFAKESAHPEPLTSSTTPGPIYQVPELFGHGVRGAVSFSKAKRFVTGSSCDERKVEPVSTTIDSVCPASKSSLLNPSSMPQADALLSESSQRTDSSSEQRDQDDSKQFSHDHHPGYLDSLTAADFDELDPHHQLLEMDNDMDSLLRGLRRRPPPRP